MPLAGSTATFPISLQDSSGTALVYADKTAFTGAGWNVVFYDASGAAISPQPTWDLVTGTTATQADVYLISYTVPAGRYTAVVDVLGTNYAAPIAYTDEGETATLDSLYGAFIQSNGSIATNNTAAGSITVYQGDSISVDAIVLDSALTAIGASSLADVDTIAAELKLITTNGTAVPEVATFGEAIISDTVGNRLVRITLDAYPAALNVDGPNGTSVQARIDLRLTEGTKTITASVIDVTAVWGAAQ